MRYLLERFERCSWIVRSPLILLDCREVVDFVFHSWIWTFEGSEEGELCFVLEELLLATQSPNLARLLVYMDLKVDSG